MLKSFEIVIITCSNPNSVLSTEKEINYLKRKRRIPESLLILTIEDPAKNLGSGAATLNALLIATENLSVKHKYMVLSADVLHDSRILIIHNGRDCMYSCTEKAFIPLPLQFAPGDESSLNYASGIVSNLEATLNLMEKLSHNCPHGVWVCSTDMMIVENKSDYKDTEVDWRNVGDVVLFCTPCRSLEYATKHGVVGIDKQGHISEIIYCGHKDRIQKVMHGDGMVPLVSGIVYMNTSVAESLLSLHVQAPIDSCTYLGLDSGAKPIQVSLFFDILDAMSSKKSKESFTYYDKKHEEFYRNGTNTTLLARSLMWNELSRYRMSPKILFGFEHLYWCTENCAQDHMKKLFHVADSSQIHSNFEGAKVLCAQESLIINSLVKAPVLIEISAGSIVFNVDFEVNSLSVGECSYVYGVSVQDELADLHIPSNLAVIEVRTRGTTKSRTILMFGIQENLESEMTSATFCNKSWENHLKYLNITEKDLWLNSEQKTLMHAKLFIPGLSFQDTLDLFVKQAPTCMIDLQKRFKESERYSINEVLNMMEYSSIHDYKRCLYSKISANIIKRVLLNDEKTPLLPYFYAACADDCHLAAMDALDQILLQEGRQPIITRTLSNLADLLATMAGSQGGLRTGPGSNPAWSFGFSLLMKGDIVQGLQALKSERSNWLDRPDHIMRAARHYERAVQILIQRSVSSVMQFITLSSSKLPEIGAKVLAECPARIDLQGGWTDTPPICFELGGSVINVAVLIDGKKPIGAEAFRTVEPFIVLKLGLLDLCQKIKIKDMKDVLNYDQPNAQGALLKACLISADIIDINSDVPLSDQLLMRFGGGFHLQSWSLLPQGCGMGTSSILAGAIVSALWTVSGKTFQKIDVVHAVLYVEQLLTTGGGWQDQVSGIMGGINRGYSHAILPLKVHVEPVAINLDIIEKLNSHLVLVNTGKVRLAKNLLQNVIRNWYAREKTVVHCFEELLHNSLQMKAALETGNLAEIGELMNKYWEQKKVLAPGCEPLIVKNLMEQLRPICYGMLLAGAGGGGFMCILTKEPHAQESVQMALSASMNNQKMTLHTVAVDSTGLAVKL